MLKRIYIILVAISFFAIISVAQVVKCKATAFTYKTKNAETELWSSWADWQEVNILVVIDPKIERIKIFSKEEQTYDIIQAFDKAVDSDGDVVYQWMCVNSDGKKCYVKIIKLLSREGQNQLYVEFSDMMWVYNVYYLEN
jgi:hypothetical protein